jgi:hypothetical protein
MNNESNESARNENEVNADALTGKVKNKQHPIVAYESDKLTIQELKLEYGLKCDQEAINMVLTAATDHRYDKDGNDKFQVIADRIIDSREGKKTKNNLSSQLDKVRELAAKMGITVEQVAEMMKG